MKEIAHNKSLEEMQAALIERFSNEPAALPYRIAETVYYTQGMMDEYDLWKRYDIAGKKDHGEFLHDVLIPFAWEFEYWWEIENAKENEDYIWILEDVFYRKMAETFGNKEEE